MLNEEKQSAILKAMADETRLRLIRLLSREELNVQEICEILDFPQPRISRNLSVLKSIKLVNDRREGTRIYYSMAQLDEDLQLMAPYIDSIAQSPHADLNLLDKILAKRANLSKDFASNMAESWDEVGSELHSPTAALFSLTALAPRDMTVADLGCGTGLMLPVLSKFAGKVYAVDHAEKMLQLAEKRCDQLGIDNVEFIQNPINEIKDIQACDAVLLHFVLHQVASPQSLISSLKPILKKGGRLVIVDRQKHDDEHARDKFGSIWLGFDKEQISSWLSEISSDIQYQEFASSNAGGKISSFIISAVID